MNALVKRISVTVFLLFISFLTFSQPPAGYYDAAAGLSGNDLKVALQGIIDNHTVRSYTQLWTDMQTTDVKANGKVWDMYSDDGTASPPYEFTFITDQCGTYSVEGDCYNREHSFPKSWFSDASPMYTDLFHLYPTDGKVNGQRSNWPFGEVTSPTWTSQNGSKLGPNSYPGYTGTVFEPIDIYKGDFARSYFYMMTRYQDLVSGWTSDMLSGGDLATWAVNMLIEWHQNDPVSTKETDRNDAVYGIQGNRNPFIDHPEYVECIWAANCGTSPQITSIATSPSSPTSSDAVSVSATITDDVSVSSATLYWGTDGSTFPNSISMTNSSGDTYVTSSTISAQSAGTTVYYKITAVDGDAESTTSSVQSYTIPKNTPTTQVTAISSSSTGGNYLSLTWTNGDGDGRIVQINTSNTFTNPTDGTDPSANSVYGGSGEQIVYNGNSNIVTITGLSANTTYYMRAFEYNNSGSNIKFITSTASGNPANFTTLSIILSEDFGTCPASGWTAINVASTQNWTCASGYNEINAYGGDVAAEDWFISSSLNLDTYINESFSFDSYTQYSDNTHPKLVLKYSTDYDGGGDPSTATWNSLTYTYPAENSLTWTSSGSIDLSSISGTSVYIAFQYTSSGTGSGTSTLWRIDNIVLSGEAAPLCTPPSTQASNIGFSSISDNSMTVSWTRGNGDNVLVLAKSGSAVDTDPTSGNSYSANSVFGSGDQIGTGNYVIYDGSGTSVAVTNLSSNTAYYFAVFEYNNTDVCYNTTELAGNQTTYGVPTLTTTSISSITSTTASSGGNISSNGGSSVTARGVCWSTSSSPTTSDSKTTDGTGTGSFTSSLSGLTGSTTYYVRAYATNSYGTAYGNEISFSTIKPEPTNHATSFSCGTVSSSSIDLTWTDASSGAAPDGYLIKASSLSLVDITDPADGTAESDGTLVKNIAQGNGTVSFTSLSESTTYYFKIYPYTNSGSTIDFKLDGTIPNTNCTTDAASGGSGCATDLIISEYIEGSSNNKAIEIYNNTGSSVDLSSYSLMKQTNGAGVFGDELTLSGTLNDGTAYLIVNSSASTTLTTAADLTTSSACIAFNGNDAVALYKFGVQIDVVGVVNQTTDWGAEVTLVRNSDITSPTTGYTISDWTSYTQDEFSYIGAHTMDCPTCEAPTTQSSSITFSNIASSGVTVNWTSGNGDGLIIKMNTSNSFTNPTNGTDPTANSAYTSGEQVVYNGSGTTVDITGLTANTQYFFKAYEYNCSGSNIKFQVTNAPENNVLTVNASGGGGSEETIVFQGFEGTGSDNWGTTINPATYNVSGDVWATVGSLSAITPSENSMMWGMQDLNNGNGGGNFYHYIDFDATDISAYNSVTLTFDYYTIGYDATDYIEYEVVYDNGSTWGTYTSLNGNTNSWTTVTVNVDDAESYIRLRIRALQDGGSDYAAIDNIKLVGTPVSSYTSTNTDYFRTCTDGAFNSTSTWQSSNDNTNWYVSTLVPDANASSITISVNNTITHSADITMKALVLESGSSFAFSTDNLTLTLQGDLIVNSSATLDLSRTGTTLNMNGSALQTISGDGTINIYNLTINNSNNITLSKDINVSNQLTLTGGKINTGSNTITVDNASTSAISGHSTSNYVNGILKRAVSATGSYDFPIGTAANYEFANVTINSSSGISYLTASFGANSGTTPNLTFNGETINTLLDAGIWTITPDAVTSVNYDITVTSRGHTNGAVAADYHTLLKRDDSGSAWDVYGDYDPADQSGSGTNPITLVRTNITSFSDFGGGVGGGSLPVELVSFTGVQVEDVIKLNWQTATETNNDYFTLEKSNDASLFTILSVIQGAGNSSSILNYESIDLSPQEGENYYRLKQTDYNGAFSYSDIITVPFNEITDVYEIHFINNDLLYVDFKENKSGDVRVIVFDIMGRILENISAELNNQQILEYNFGHLESGIYNVVIQSDKLMQAKIIIE